MMKPKLVILAVVLVFTGYFYLQQSTSAKVSSFPAYDQSKFDESQKAGKLTAVNFHASWCGNCKAQAASLESILKDPNKLKNLVVFHADFDSTKDLQKKMGVKKRTQIILFKGGKEVGRITKKSKEDILASLKAASTQ